VLNLVSYYIGGEICVNLTCFKKNKIKIAENLFSFTFKFDYRLKYYITFSTKLRLKRL
jgi:hypothetical protein